MTTNTPVITTERVDDIPLLIDQLKRMQIPDILDAYLAPHGNRRGLSLGWMTVIWLTHSLSEGDQCMNHVQPWVERRLETVRRCTGQPVTAQDVTDDRLADLLRLLSEDASWHHVEAALTGVTVRVYLGAPQVVRLDTTTVKSHGAAHEDGLLQLGFSKDYRPDLPQVKVMLASLDPLGMPIATEVVAGNVADDPLYLPTLQRVQQTLHQPGLLYVGDSKMGARTTRATIHQQGDYYLCPLNAVQLSAPHLAAYVTPLLTGDHPLTSIIRTTAAGQEREIAQAAEVTERCTTTIPGVDGGAETVVTWDERRIVVRSGAHAQAGATALKQRVAQAGNALYALNTRRQGKERLRDGAQAHQAVKAILAQYRVEGLIQVSVAEDYHTRMVRGYGGREDREEQECFVVVDPVVDSTAVTQATQNLGWRIYATNQSAAQVSLEQVVLAYRDQYLAEQGMGRLKGKPLSIAPMYVMRDDHATGLIRLLSIGLRVLTLVHYVVRDRLATAQTPLAGLYAGQPKRTTTCPTTERLLAAFQNITLTVIHGEGEDRICHLTPLSPLQQQILELLGMGTSIYTSLTEQSFELGPRMSEP